MPARSVRKDRLVSWRRLVILEPVSRLEGLEIGWPGMPGLLGKTLRVRTGLGMGHEIDLNDRDLDQSDETYRKGGLMLKVMR
jgi:hypothetical protein